MTKVTSLGMARAMRKCDNRPVTPSEIMDAALDDITAGEPVDSLIATLLNTGEDGEQHHNTSYMASNLSGSEMLALLEVTKQRILKKMGY